MQQNSWQVLSETSVRSALHCFRQCFSSWAIADAELSLAANPGGGPSVLQAGAGWGSMWSHPCGVTGWAEQGQTPGSFPLLAAFRLNIHCMMVSSLQNAASSSPALVACTAAAAAAWE